MNRDFWKATAIRCARSFISVILGFQTGGVVLVTEVDWNLALLTAFSTTFWIFLACILAGLPEVKLQDSFYALDNDPEEYSEEDDVDDEEDEEGDV